MSHTPGPWFMGQVGEDEYGFDSCSIGAFDVSDRPVKDHFEDSIAEVSGCNHDCAANARLIAAAPELLAACRLALHAFERHDAIDWSVLEQVIAKADGR